MSTTVESFETAEWLGAAYGRWLALTGMAADLAGRGSQWAKLFQLASTSTRVYPALERELAR